MREHSCLDLKHVVGIWPWLHILVFNTINQVDSFKTLSKSITVSYYGIDIVPQNISGYSPHSDCAWGISKNNLWNNVSPT